MTYEPRTPEQIEAEIEAERSKLGQTLHSIQDRVSMDHVMRNVSDTVAEQGAEIGQAAYRTIRRNPTAAALAVGGLAWLIASNARAPSRREPVHDPYAPYAHTRPPVGRDTGAPYPTATGGYPGQTGTHVDGKDSPWDRAQAGVKERAEEARASAEAGYHKARSEAEMRYERGKSRLRQGRDRVQATARDLRDRIKDGTENMSEEARQRVIAARTRAYEAQVRAEYYAREGGRRAGRFYDEQPLVAGAIALGIGAAIGGALPRTRREDAAFGAWRDELFDEAARVYQEEREKLGEVADATAQEARKQAKEAAHDVGEKAGDAAKSVEDRAKSVANKAEKEARDKNLGQVKH